MSDKGSNKLEDVFLQSKLPADPILRLFKRLTLDNLKCNLSMWKSFLDDYLEKIHPVNEDNMREVRRSRNTSIGNLNDTFWSKPSLTFKMFIVGLHILKCKRLKITIEAEFDSGRVETVTEEYMLDTIKEEKE